MTSAPCGRNSGWRLAAACCVVVLAAAGCGASQPSGAPGAADQQSGHASSRVTTQLTRSQLSALASDYMRIARPANHRLEVAVDGYRRAEHGGHLAAARADLLSQAATERHFDQQLLQIRFPAWIALTAQAMVRANNRRIPLTEAQARSTSLASLRSLDRRHKAADAAVEAQVRLIRQFLGLPPPATS